MPLDYTPTLFIDRAYGGQVKSVLPVMVAPASNAGGVLLPFASPDWTVVTVAALGAGATSNLIVNGAGTYAVLLAVIINATTAGKLTLRLAASNKIRMNVVANVDYVLFPSNHMLLQTQAAQTIDIKNDGGAAITFDISYQFVQNSLV